MSELSFKIDATRCVHCGACAADCPVRVIQQKNKDGIPFVSPEKEKNCIHCQHCLAVCPTGALSIFGKNPADSLPLKGLDLPSAVQMDNLLHARRSIRKFQARDVDPVLLRKVFATLANAPTGCNARELTFTVWDTQAAMNTFRASIIAAIESHRDGTKLLPRWLAIPAIRYRRTGHDEFFRNAPHLLVISADETDPHTTTPVPDIASALACFDLLAQANGIGTCWCGFLEIISRHVPEVRTVLGLGPKTPFYAMLFGYPALRYARTVQRDGDAKVVFRG